MKVARREAQKLEQRDYDSAMEWMYPKRDQIEAGENVRYVDKRNIPEMAGVLSANDWRVIDRAFSAGFGWMNEPGRIVYLFARVAYGINFLGSAALTMIHQGPFGPGNALRAFRADELYGSFVAQTVRELAGSSRSLSFATERRGITKVSQGMAKFWSKFTDDKWREAAVYHEMHRQGILTKDGISPEQLEAGIKANDPAIMRKLSIVRQKARKAMVDFDNLTWPEKAVMRHLFFIYGWMTRSAVAAIYAFLEHPVKATLAAEAGTEYRDEIERILGHQPEWFPREGWIPFSRSFVSNPLQFSIASSLRRSDTRSSPCSRARCATPTWPICSAPLPPSGLAWSLPNSTVRTRAG